MDDFFVLCLFVVQTFDQFECIKHTHSPYTYFHIHKQPFFSIRPFQKQNIINKYDHHNASSRIKMNETINILQNLFNSFFEKYNLLKKKFIANF